MNFTTNLETLIILKSVCSKLGHIYKLRVKGNIVTGMFCCFEISILVLVFIKLENQEIWLKYHSLYYSQELLI